MPSGSSLNASASLQDPLRLPRQYRIWTALIFGEQEHHPLHCWKCAKIQYPTILFCFTSRSQARSTAQSRHKARYWDLERTHPGRAELQNGSLFVLCAATSLGPRTYELTAIQQTQTSRTVSGNVIETSTRRFIFAASPQDGRPNGPAQRRAACGATAGAGGWASAFWSTQIINVLRIASNGERS